MSVKEFVLATLAKHPELSNIEIADRARKLLRSQTTAANIAWYKSRCSKDLSNKKKIAHLKNDKKDTTIIEKFKDCYIVGSQEATLAVLGAEARNIVQYLFKKRKPRKCEFRKCDTKNEQALHTCHIGKERLDILKDSLDRTKTSKGYDVYRALTLFKEIHQGFKPQDIRYLCSKHHNELDKNKTVKNKIRFAERHLNKLPK